MKQLHRLGSAVSLALALGAFSLSASAAPPISMQTEEAAHPRIVEAIHHMREALHELQAAPDDFGGHKAQAIHDCEVAIHSLRKALYFRLRMDDAAIDRIS